MLSLAPLPPPPATPTPPLRRVASSHLLRAAETVSGLALMKGEGSGGAGRGDHFHPRLDSPFPLPAPFIIHPAAGRVHLPSCKSYRRCCARGGEWGRLEVAGGQNLRWASSLQSSGASRLALGIHAQTVPTD